MFSRLLNALFPPVCLGCRRRVESPGALCPSCFGRLRFITAPVCALCGRPLPGGEYSAPVCGGCLVRRPAFRTARSALCYEETSRALILGLKYGDRLDVAPLMARMMMNAGRDVLERADVLIPVPLHWKRLFVRKYNQSAVLAEALSEKCGVPTDSFILKRTKATPKQGHFSHAERIENVRDVFAVNPRRDIGGRRVVLIDDVLTSGATAESCARTLYAAGAADVSVLTLARVVEGIDS